MRFRVLGPIEVWDGDHKLPVPAGRQRTLLAYLLVNRDSVVTTDRLVDELWQAAAPPTAGKIVRNLVSELRKLIGDANGVALVSEGRGYRLHVPAEQIDATRFERRATEGRRLLEHRDAAAAARVLREALDLWRGDPFADVADEPFVRSEVSKLEELRLGCFEELVDAELALGRHAELVPRLEAEIRREPLRERLRAQLMLALYRSGRQADALSAYQDARRTLVDELGLEPGPDLRRLETAILAQDPLLDAPVRGAIALRRRGRWLIALGAGALLLAAAAVALVLARGDQNTGLAALTPNSIGAIDPETGRIVAQVPLGAGVARLSASDDTVWGLSTTERTLYRVDASRRSLTGSARFDGVVADVAAAGDDVWVMHAGPSGRSLVTRFAGDQEVPLRLGSVDLGVDLTGATASTVGTVDDSIAASARTVWATTNAVRPRGGLALVDTSDERVRQVDLGPVYGLADDNETVWLVGQQLLWHLDSDGDVDLELPLASPGIAIDVASGESGVWAVTTAWIRYHGNSAQRIGRSLLTRVNAEAEAVETTIPVGGLPETVAAGLGSVWVTDIERNAVLRIDPRTNTVVETIRLGARPTSVALAGGLVWVAVI